MKDHASADQLHETSSTKGGQIRRARSAVRVEVDPAPAPTQTPPHVPGQALRLRGARRKRGQR